MEGHVVWKNDADSCSTRTTACLSQFSCASWAQFYTYYSVGRRGQSGQLRGFWRVHGYTAGWGIELGFEKPMGPEDFGRQRSTEKGWV